MNNRPRDLDDDRRVVEPFRLPEHMKQESRVNSTAPAKQPTYLEQLEASIKNDPLKQIACTVCYLRFKDMVQLAKEICELVDAPPGSDAEVSALKFAVKMHKWAEDKFPDEP